MRSWLWSVFQKIECLHPQGIFLLHVICVKEPHHAEEFLSLRNLTEGYTVVNLYSFCCFGFHQSLPVFFYHLFWCNPRTLRVHQQHFLLLKMIFFRFPESHVRCFFDHFTILFQCFLVDDDFCCYTLVQVVLVILCRLYQLKPDCENCIHSSLVWLSILDFLLRILQSFFHLSCLTIVIFWCSSYLKHFQQ